MDLRVQAHTDSPASGGSVNGGPSSASTVHDVLAQRNGEVSPGLPDATPPSSRAPRSAHHPLYDAVHSAAGAAAGAADDAPAAPHAASHVLHAATDYVSAHPFKSLGIAFAAGWLFARSAR